MSELDYEETRFVTDVGTVVVKAWPSSDYAWLGLSLGRNHEDEPDIVVKLGPSLRRRVAEALLDMRSET